MQNFISRLLLVAALLGVLFWGCEEQEPPEGKMSCNDNSECPSGWFCDPSDSLCYSSEETGT